MLTNHQSEGYYLLANLIKVLKPKQIINFRNLPITKIVQHSQKVTPHSLFIAIPGFSTDGHQYITTAVQQGAAAIIGEQSSPQVKNTPYIQVPNSRRALAKLAAEFYNYPSDKLKLIGVTGSTGKTTTTKMINQLLKQATPNTGLIGSLHTKIKTDTYPQPQDCTTPQPLELNKRLSAMEQAGVEYVSLEVSSHALKLERVTELDFDLGIFTNLSPDHLNFHKTLTDYYQSKAQLFTSLEPPAVAILNHDDPYAQQLTNQISVPYLTYGLSEEADLKATNLQINKQETKFQVVFNNQLQSLTGKQIPLTTIPLNLSVLGKHNIYNALAAFTAGLMLDLTLNQIQQGLEEFSGVKRRLEVIYDQEFTIIDDFAHNPASLKANFNTLQKFDYNNLIIVHFLKGKRGVAANRRNAKLIANWQQTLKITKLITTAADNRVKPKNKVLPAETAAFKETIAQHGLTVEHYQELLPALQHALQVVNPQDLLLLVGGPGLNQAHQLITDHLL